jgi:hypothetical protein
MPSLRAQEREKSLKNEDSTPMQSRQNGAVTRRVKAKKKYNATSKCKQEGEEKGAGNSTPTVYSELYCKCPSSRSVEAQINDKEPNYVHRDMLRNFCEDSDGNLLRKGWVDYIKKDGRFKIRQIVC